MDEATLEALKAFVHKFYALPDPAARLKFYRNPGPSFKGRDALREWVGDRWGHWGVNAIIDGALESVGRTMYSVATADGSTVRSPDLCLYTTANIV